jgi:hypothetical protein
MFSGYKSLEVQQASERKMVGSGNLTSAEDWDQFQNCVKLYLKCKLPRIPRLPSDSDD